jgi:3-hydroxyisobutyrate dehydrogenase-like beta-hydroxyacid dehydrogenase
VSGGRNGAIRGSLAIMVAAPRSTYEEVENILKVFGKVFYVGEKAGLAQTMKLVNNMLSVAALAITSEGMVMGVKAGLDPSVMLDIINASSGRNSATTDKFPRAVLPRTFDFGFATGLSVKDIRLPGHDPLVLVRYPAALPGVRDIVRLARHGHTSDVTGRRRFKRIGSYHSTSGV